METGPAIRASGRGDQADPGQARRRNRAYRRGGARRLSRSAGDGLGAGQGQPLSPFDRPARRRVSLGRQPRRVRRYRRPSPNERPGWIDFSRPTGRLRRGDRLDQARIVIPDVADARAHRPADHIGRVGGQQRLQIRHVGRLFAKPSRPCLGLEDHRHPIMDSGAQLVRRGGDDRETAHPLAGSQCLTCCSPSAATAARRPRRRASGTKPLISIPRPSDSGGSRHPFERLVPGGRSSRAACRTTCASRRPSAPRL